MDVLPTFLCAAGAPVPANADAGLLYQDPPKARPVLPAAYGLVYPKENFLGF